MHPFEELIYSRFADGVRSWDLVRYPDIYAVSFLCSYAIGGPGGDSEITVDVASLSYNSLRHYATQIAKASDAAEAKWNIAFWLQDTPAVEVPANVDDGGGIGFFSSDDLALIDDYATALGHPPQELFLGDAYHRVPDLLPLLGRVAKRFHAEGLLEATLGRAVPILIHTLVYDAEGTRATRDANPADLVEELFRDFLGCADR